jgi:succinate dehydrogenase / fumarate reductase iron-sulfur subunit
MDTEGRRRALATFVAVAMGAVGTALAAVAGAFVTPRRAKHSAGAWRRAAALTDLTAGVPFAATVLVPVDDGWRRARVPQTVFLIWDGKDSIRALSSACTHLGCRVAFDTESKRFACPCHGGFYDVQGQVVAGPPPSPLASLEARAVVERDEVMVRV